MKTNVEWGFTDAPDFPRICRELEAAGSAVGRVTQKDTSRVVTLFDGRRAAMPAGKVSVPIVGAPPHWRLLEGDHVIATLKIGPVRVEGFKATRMTEPARDPVQRSIGATTIGVAAHRAFAGAPLYFDLKTAMRNFGKPSPFNAFTARVPPAADSILASITLAASRHQNGVWETAGGTRVGVKHMPESHLLFALAKARRGEYLLTAERREMIEALEAEALRRLLAKPTKLNLTTGEPTARPYAPGKL
jgi:hypothetical protein